MIVYRTTHKDYQDDMWSGKGAAEQGGRWNTIGHPVVYTAESQSLSILENLVKIDLLQNLLDYVTATATVPDNLVETIDAGALPPDWWNPQVGKATGLLGDQWLAGSKLAFRVPSAVVRTEFDILINPLHHDIGKVVYTKSKPLPIDPRLLKIQK